MASTLLSSKNRKRKTKRSEVLRDSSPSDAPPALNDSKGLYVLMRKMSAGENCVLNFSRSVLQAEYEPESARSYEVVGDKRRQMQSTACAVTRAPSILDAARRLDRLGRTDAALDIVYDRVDELLLANGFDKVDRLLAEACERDYSIELLLGLLTITLPAKNHLDSRGDFFARVEKWLQSQGKLDDGLLVGLE